MQVSSHFLDAVLPAKTGCFLLPFPNPLFPRSYYRQRSFTSVSIFPLVAIFNLVFLVDFTSLSFDLRRSLVNIGLGGLEVDSSSSCLPICFVFIMRSSATALATAVLGAGSALAGVAPLKTRSLTSVTVQGNGRV